MNTNTNQELLDFKIDTENIDISTIFSAEFATIRPAVLGLLFMWGFITLLTTLLVSRVMTPIVASQINILGDLALPCAIVITIIMGFFFSMVFEGTACWLLFQNQKTYSVIFSLVSGVLSLFGFLRNLPTDFNFQTINDISIIILYVIFGFSPQSTIIVLSHVLYLKLQENGLLVIFKKVFVALIKAQISNMFSNQPKKQNENPFVEIFKQQFKNVA